MRIATVPRLTAPEVEQLDPSACMAVLGKRVIHPGSQLAGYAFDSAAPASCNVRA
jgi:hypothetical protein